MGIKMATTFFWSAKKTFRESKENCGGSTGVMRQRKHRKERGIEKVGRRLQVRQGENINLQHDGIAEGKKKIKNQINGKSGRNLAD